MPDSAPSDPPASDTSAERTGATDGAPEVSAALGALQEELEALAEATTHIEESKEAARKSAEASEVLCEQSQALAASTERLIKQIDGIDFPSRLEKLDATVAGINTGVQNLQGRLSDTERALREDLSELRSDQKERLRRIEYFLYAAIALSLLACGLVLFV